MVSGYNRPEDYKDMLIGLGMEMDDYICLLDEDIVIGDRNGLGRSQQNITA